MDVLITSFGRDYRQSRLEHDRRMPFYGMPPAIVAESGTGLKPDHIPFILAEQVLMDGEFYERLTTLPHPLYTEVADFFKSAFSAGRVKLIDIDELPKNQPDTLNQMLEFDLNDLGKWEQAFKESKRIRKTLSLGSQLIGSRFEEELWENIYKQTALRLEPGSKRNVEKDFPLNFRGTWPISRATVRREPLPAEVSARIDAELLQTHLAYVNLNIVNSFIHGAQIYDWADMDPFYTSKANGTDNPETRPFESAKRVISLLFPNFAFTETRRFLKLLDDPRIGEVRSLFEQATKNPEQYDQRWAQQILNDMFDAEHRITTISNRLSWHCFPFSILPFPFSLLGTIAEKIGSQHLVNSERQPLEWAYFLRSFSYQRGE